MLLPLRKATIMHLLPTYKSKLKAPRFTKTSLCHCNWIFYFYRWGNKVDKRSLTGQSINPNLPETDPYIVILKLYSAAHVVYDIQNLMTRSQQTSSCWSVDCFYIVSLSRINVFHFCCHWESICSNGSSSTCFNVGEIQSTCHAPPPIGNVLGGGGLQIHHSKVTWNSVR